MVNKRLFILTFFCFCRLGKTIQVISFLAGMFDAQLIKRVLIVMPVSVMPNWENEFNKW